jgi:hypothetical protein
MKGNEMTPISNNQIIHKFSLHVDIMYIHECPQNTATFTIIIIYTLKDCNAGLKDTSVTTIK